MVPACGNGLQQICGAPIGLIRLYEQAIGENVRQSFQILEKGSHLWALFDQNIVTAMLEEQHLPKNLEDFIKEEDKPALKDAFEELLDLHPSTLTLVQRMSRTIHKLATAGGVILIGRGAHIICANLSHAFHVRLVAPLNSRIQHIADYFGLSEKEAAAYVQRQDRDRKQYIRRYFGADITIFIPITTILSLIRVNSVTKKPRISLWSEGEKEVFSHAASATRR